MPRGRIIRGSTSVYFSLQKTSHSRCRSDENKSPLIRRSKDVNHVVPPFYRLLTEKPALSGHLATTAAVTGSPDFPTIRFRKSTPRCVSRLTAASFHQPETL